jgi:ABC-type multidrug transport system fused ATPase/permease subunit
MKLNRAFARETGAMTDLLTQTLYATPLLRNYSATPEALNRFQAQQWRVSGLQLNMVYLRAWLLPAVRLGGSLGLGLVLLLIAWKKDLHLYTVGSITSYLGYTALLISPLSLLSWVVTMGQNAITGVERIEEVNSKPGVLPLQLSKAGKLSRLVMHDVSVSRALDHVSLHWKRG